jgi:hypothetical protein
MYVDRKVQLIEEAIRDGHEAGFVDPRFTASEEGKCKLAVEGLDEGIKLAVGIYLGGVELATPGLAGYAAGHFTEWHVMVKASVRIAKRGSRFEVQLQLQARSIPEQRHYDRLHYSPCQTQENRVQ